jgi:hypothetical protein
MQPVEALQVFVVQVLPSSQDFALQAVLLVAGVQTWQAFAAFVWASLWHIPSIRHFPCCTAFTHPMVGSQESVVHVIWSSHDCPACAMHWPPAQVLGFVQSNAAQNPDEQTFPSFTGSCLHPTAFTHESRVQAFWSSQSSGPVPRQSPDWQVSPIVQGSLSSQAFEFDGKAQPSAGEQVSSVQSLPSTHWRLPPPPMHCPAMQVIGLVHRTSTQAPATHVVPVSTFLRLHPAFGSQVSTVQGLPSSQSWTWPGMQVPAGHVATGVHFNPAHEPTVHVPQSFPQPSSPHSLPLHWGTQASHAPSLHPNGQSTTFVPWAPQLSNQQTAWAQQALWSSAAQAQVPAWHTLPSVQVPQVPPQPSSPHSRSWHERRQESSAVSRGATSGDTSATSMVAGMSLSRASPRSAEISASGSWASDNPPGS